MLELVRREEEKFLLERTNLKFDGIYNLCSRFNAYVCIYPIPKLLGYQQLSKELKEHKEFRIWYSSTSSEDLNTYYYLLIKSIIISKIQLFMLLMPQNIVVTLIISLVVLKKK